MLHTDTVSIVAEFVPLQHRFLILTRVWRIPKGVHRKWRKEWIGIHVAAEMRARAEQAADRKKWSARGFLLWGTPPWNGCGRYEHTELRRLFGVVASWNDTSHHAADLNRAMWSTWKRKNNRHRLKHTSPKPCSRT